MKSDRWKKAWMQYATACKKEAKQNFALYHPEEMVLETFNSLLLAVEV